MPEFGFEDLSGSRNGIALVVEKTLDAHGHLDIAAAIETLPRAALVGFELRKLALPEAEDVGGHIAKFGNFADAEVEFVRDVGPGGGGISADCLVLRHARNSDTAVPVWVACVPTCDSIGQTILRGLEFFLGAKDAGRQCQ